MPYEILKSDPSGPMGYPIGQKFISKGVLERAKAHLGEDEERLRDTLLIIKEHIREHDLRFDENDEYLIRFIRFRKFICPRILETIRHHMEMADAIVQRIGIPDAGVVKEVLRQCVTGILPYQDAEGRAILYGQKASFLFGEVSAKALMQAMMVISFYIIQDPATQLNGLTLLLDSSGMSIQNIASYLECMRIVFLILKCNPGAYKRVHVFNTGLIAKLLLRLARPFISSKLVQRTRFHGKDPDELLEYYEPSLLPQEFGGTLGPISNEHWMHEVEPTCKFIRNYIYTYSTLPLPPQTCHLQS